MRVNDLVVIEASRDLAHAKQLTSRLACGLVLIDYRKSRTAMTSLL